MFIENQTGKVPAYDLVKTRECMWYYTFQEGVSIIWVPCTNSQKMLYIYILTRLVAFSYSIMCNLLKSAKRFLKSGNLNGLSGNV